MPLLLRLLTLLLLLLLMLLLFPMLLHLLLKTLDKYRRWAAQRFRSSSLLSSRR